MSTRTDSLPDQSRIESPFSYHGTLDRGLFVGLHLSVVEMKLRLSFYGSPSTVTPSQRCNMLSVVIRDTFDLLLRPIGCTTAFFSVSCPPTA